jgi:superfamily II DNA or RNA helicase
MSNLCSEIDLAEYQCGPAFWLSKHPEQRGLLCFYGTGYGKTLTAVPMIIKLYDMKLIDRVVTISPKSVLQNIKKSFDICGSSLHLKKIISSFTYEKIEIDPSLVGAITKRTLVIIDEAHRLREISTNTYKKIKPICHECGFLLLLTATPIVNRSSDILNILHLINPSIPTYTQQSIQPNLNIFETYTKKLIAFPDVDKSHEFPERIDILVKVVLDANQINAIQKYDKKFRKNSLICEMPSNAYLNKTRQYSIGINDSISTKVKEIAKNVKSNLPALIFCEFISSGVLYLEKSLKGLLPSNINIGTLTGKDSLKQREKLVESINTGKLDVLILSAAGSEGLDFKGVRSVHLTNTNWNPARTDQQIGRAVRFRSHLHLPENERKVKAFQYISIPPEGENICKQKCNAECTEIRLFQLETKKRLEIKKVHEILQKNKIQHSCNDKEKNEVTVLKKKLSMCSAKNVPEGYIFTALNGKQYKVIKTKTGKKRWKQVKSLI